MIESDFCFRLIQNFCLGKDFGVYVETILVIFVLNDRGRLQQLSFVCFNCQI